ncbi:hypothetical protein ACEPPN_007599 [Leptodophora sp. 'Broadleaf-Isolate-01']
MAKGDSVRPTEPSKIVTAIWRTSSDETCTVKIAFAMRVHIFGETVNLIKKDQTDWEGTVPPNHTCTVFEGEGVTFKEA